MESELASLEGCKDKHGNEYVYDIRKSELLGMKRFIKSGCDREGLPCLALAVTTHGIEIPLSKQEHVSLCEKILGLEPLVKPVAPVVEIAPTAIPNRTEKLLELKKQQEQVNKDIKTLQATTSSADAAAKLVGGTK